MKRILLCLLLFGASAAFSQDTELPPEQPDAPENSPVPETEIPGDAIAEPPMTVGRLGEIIRVLDPEARARGAMIEFTVQDIPVIVVADSRADRMRAMVPIRSADGITPAEMKRLMQANFDSALDARYAVAQGRLWGVYIHPLSPLDQNQFLSGVAQTINVARTYGQTYSGGANVFGGGDSNGIFRQLQEELRKGQEL